MRTTIKKIPKPLLGLAVLSIAFGIFLVLTELAVRVLVPKPDVLEPYTVDVWFNGKWVALPPGGHSLLLGPSSDPDLSELRGEFRPRTRFRMCYDTSGGWRRPYFDDKGCVEVEINPAGQRGPLRSPEKPPGTYRVALVGDSFTFGHGVSYGDTWAFVLEQELNSALDAGNRSADQLRQDPETQRPSRAEVLNFGVSGYDVFDVALVTRFKALKWAPDRVLYGFFLNDLFVGEDEASDSGATEAWHNVDESELHDRLFGTPHGLAAHSRLYFLIDRAFASRRIDAMTRGAYLAAGLPGSSHFEAWRTGLEDMAAACRDASVALDVVIFPELVHLDGSHPYLPVYSAVREAAEDLGLGVVDIFEDWKGQEASELWVHPTDHHPNEVAHGEAGRRIGEFLLDADPLLR